MVPDTLPPFKDLGMVKPNVRIDRRSDGTIIMESAYDVGAAPKSIGHLLTERAVRHPERALLRQRADGRGSWRTISYGEANRAAEGIAQFLLDQELGRGDAVMVLSGNSIEHAFLMLGCLTAGVTVVPISPTFSLAPAGRSRLLHCAHTVKPRVVFAQSSEMFADAIAAMRDWDPTILFVTVDGGSETLSLSSLIDVIPTGAVAEAREGIRPEDHAKILFTSGSTGLPKAVPQTQGMLTAVIAGLAGLRTGGSGIENAEFLEWMPWSHIAAGNINFNSVLDAGGTLYLDDGRPVPGMFDATLRNLREVSPLFFASAPIAFGMLADALEREPELRKTFFRNLSYMAYGGATLSNDIYERLQALAIAETGYRIPVTTLYGSTETQGVTMTHWPTERVGLIGLPLPGMVLKLVPAGPKLELRVRGPSVMTGYLHDAERTAAAFDEEGFYRLGDAVRFVDDEDPAKGLWFDGRLTEDFKLNTGTWVSVGTLRPEIVAACSPYVQDAVIAGQDQCFVAALIWASAAALRQIDRGEIDWDELTSIVAEKLAQHNATAGGSSRRIERFSFERIPLDLATGEITDKGYINQLAVLTSRAAAIADLYHVPVPEKVFIVEPRSESGRESEGALSL
jgi:feruloyl-CoA synthase